MSKIATTLLSLLIAAVAVGCHVTPEKAPTSSAIHEVPPHCAGRLITFDEAQQLMDDCQVVSLGQPHEGPVILTLRDETRACFFQPHLDWVIAKANQVCPTSPIQMTIE